MTHIKGLIIGCFTLLLLPSLAYANSSANNVCRSSSSASPGNNTVNVKLSSLRPFNLTPLNGVLGTIAMSGNITCFDEPNSIWNSRYDFYIQVKPNEGSGNVCPTPLDGIGIRYRNINGEYISCSGWSEVFKIEKPSRGSSHAMSVPVLAELVKTKASTTLAPGLHDVSLSTKGKLLSYWYAGSNSTDWAPLKLSTSAQLLVTPCSITDVQQTVDFGFVAAANIINDTIRKPFKLGIGNCGSQQNAEFFNNAASFRFESANLRTDGSLDIKCKGCATGVVIEIETEDGKTIDLNRTFKLKDGTFDIDSQTIKQRFNAKLKRDPSSPLTVGKIDSILTIVIDTL
ncbi:fimbrial protein [Pseudomonas sp. BN417]|uniref:fimbrial protein n=1 Tax=Pseudomonas sp. BN417 TaxID=2567890 RepID=UPI002453BBD4|nr:fimbrial protein [Pseudomonas sp. BN417]MDH4556450.1 fimbrial protein [Pseudomonas sp. BN417]